MAYLVGHHHTLQDIHGMDYQILIEADYIANASENGYGKQSVMHFMDTVMKTASGKCLAASVLGISARLPCRRPSRFLRAGRHPHDYLVAGPAGFCAQGVIPAGFDDPSAGPAGFCGGALYVSVISAARAGRQYSRGL